VIDLNITAMEPGPSIKRRRHYGSAPEEVESELAKYLLTEFAWGTFSSQQVQHIAALFFRDQEAWISS
jgi:hypothetical protein